MFCHRCNVDNYGSRYLTVLLSKSFLDSYALDIIMLEKNRKDDSISVAKGLAILLMVLAHAGFPEYGNRMIYMFHMPLFFFISGYLFKDCYLFDLKAFITQRIKKLYIPFVKYGVLKRCSLFGDWGH